MKAFRWVLAGLLGVVGGLLAVVGVLLCVTLVLAPVGLLVLFLAKRLFRMAGQLVMPRRVRHPIDELDRSGSRAASALKGKAGRATGAAADMTADLRKKGVKRAKRLRKKARR